MARGGVSMAGMSRNSLVFEFFRVAFGCISINIIFSAVAFVIPGHYGAVPTTSNNFTQGWVSKYPR